MANKLLDIQADVKQIAKLKQKMANYPPYVIEQGINAVAEYLNDDEFRESMYPPESDEPFLWSSEKQRRAYFATDGFGKGIPYVRTHELMYSGVFKVKKSRASAWITYENLAPYAPWVIGSFTQIVGHIARGWRPANSFVVDKASEITKTFDRGTEGAWDKMSSFMTGGAPGL
jgi:hypothetical protein